MELQYALTLQQSKDAKKAKSILKNYLKDHYDENIMEIIIENDLKNGDKKEAIDYYKTEIENSPFSAGKCSKLAMVYYEMHEYDEAMEWIQKSLKLCPYTGRYFYSAGLIYNGKGNKEKAIEMMRKCVYYSPANYEAREKLRMLENKKKLFEYFKQNDVVKIYKEAQENPAYAKEELVILINDKREIVYPEHGAGEEQEEMLVYINSQTAIHRYKEYAIPHNGYNQKLIVEKAELLLKETVARFRLNARRDMWCFRQWRLAMPCIYIISLKTLMKANLPSISGMACISVMFTRFRVPVLVC